MIITDFSQDTHAGSDFLEQIPEHTMEAIDHYLIKGWHPGGFLTGLITEDYKTALGSADQANKQRFWFVAAWLTIFAPKGSVGSNKIMRDWIADKNGIRSAYVEQATKDYEWKVLSNKVEIC